MAQKASPPKTLYFFVDESGDPTFFNKKSEYIVGQEGCSPILQIGFIRTVDPSPLRQAVLKLHDSIKGDAYLKDIPSIQGTHIAFHAKNDAPEVREKFFKVIQALDFKAEFVIARKRLDVFSKRHNRSEDVFYNELISRLFENKLHKQDNIIYFSKRGNRLKQAHLANALQTAALNFETKYKIKVTTGKEIYIQVPSDEPCLQIADYMNWAVQRAFLKSDMRYYNFVQDKISFICDIYDFDKYPKNFYGKGNPFDIKKISPL